MTKLMAILGCLALMLVAVPALADPPPQPPGQPTPGQPDCAPHCNLIDSLPGPYAPIASLEPMLLAKSSTGTSVSGGKRPNPKPNNAGK